MLIATISAICGIPRHGASEFNKDSSSEVKRNVHDVNLVFDAMNTRKYSSNKVIHWRDLDYQVFGRNAVCRKSMKLILFLSMENLNCKNCVVLQVQI